MERKILPSGLLKGLLIFIPIYLVLAVAINFTIYKLMEDSTTTTIPVATTTVTNPTVTATQLQAQITALLAQVEVLQNQMMTQGRISGTACYFSRDLTIGASGDDVVCLQAYLINTLPTYYNGVGWPADLALTGFFDQSTQSALAVWQGYNGLVPNGYFDMGSIVTYSHLTRGKG